jgi:hypothetical protein
MNTSCNFNDEWIVDPDEKRISNNLTVQLLYGWYDEE